MSTDGAYMVGKTNLHSLAESLIIASYLNWGLFGVLSLQVYNYYSNFRDDVIYIKVIVYAVFALELAQTGVVSGNVFTALASGHGDPSMINDSREFWLTIPLVGGIVGTICQLCFALRMWRMSTGGSKVAPVIVSVLAAASLAASIAAAAFFRKTAFSDLLLDSAVNKRIPFIVWNGIGSICDIVISLTMPYYLMRSGTGYLATHVIVVRLVALIIETGLLTSIVVVTHLALIAPFQVGFVVPGVSMSKVYAITMLVLLNRRKNDREMIAQGRRHRSNSNPLEPVRSNPVMEYESMAPPTIRVGSNALRVALPSNVGRPVPYSGSDGSNYTATRDGSNYNMDGSNYNADGSNYSHGGDGRNHNRGGSDANLLSS